ncbi:Lysine efflux permease [Thiomonas sp. X19]|uniref:LysE/ArgO family amino acid transporter n=1 Tax=Thiomonas sp. X19 TaxID=1050370 RepID=UPI000B658FB2|nr:LysE family transporter [Thiomonas sp. X19]SCC92872.1 Lysine efflux permease [Thiomonas sp. X19]
MTTTSALSQGLLLGLGVFIYPGPKDIVVLRMALAGRWPPGLVAIGAFSDALLITIGMAGVSAMLQQSSPLQHTALWIGVVVMSWHGQRAARAALRGDAEVAKWQATEPAERTAPRGNGWPELLAASLLNPVAWLDTLFILGTVGAALPAPQRPAFTLGAVLASALWFSLLVWGASRASAWVTSTAVWRILDGFVALCLLGLAAYVAAGLL